MREGGEAREIFLILWRDSGQKASDFAKSHALRVFLIIPLLQIEKAHCPIVLSKSHLRNFSWKEEVVVRSDSQ